MSFFFSTVRQMHCVQFICKFSYVDDVKQCTYFYSVQLTDVLILQINNIYSSRNFSYRLSRRKMVEHQVKRLFGLSFKKFKLNKSTSCFYILNDKIEVGTVRHEPRHFFSYSSAAVAIPYACTFTLLPRRKEAVKLLMGLGFVWISADLYKA